MRDKRIKIKLLPGALLAAIFAISAVFAACILPRSGFSSHAQKAEDLRKQAKFEEAVSEYLLHIDERLRATRRPPDENPYFYYILIGDTYLERHEPARAEQFYSKALDKKVEQALLSDRFRTLGEWYKKRNDFENAFKVLKKYREIDPMMFDFEIDAVHKAQVEKEEQEEHHR